MLLWEIKWFSGECYRYLLATTPYIFKGLEVVPYTEVITRAHGSVFVFI
jgi:hypothetical protein